MYNHASMPPKQTEIVEVGKPMTMKEIYKKIDSFSSLREAFEFIDTLSLTNKEYIELNGYISRTTEEIERETNKIVEQIDNRISKLKKFVEKTETFLSGLSKQSFERSLVDSTIVYNKQNSDDIISK